MSDDLRFSDESRLEAGAEMGDGELDSTEPSNARSPQSEVRRLQQLVRELELQLRSHRHAAALLEGQLDKTKDTLSFKLGYLLIHGPKSWANLRRLPGELLELHREAKRRRAMRRSPADSIGGSSRAEASLRVWGRPEQFADDALRVFLAQDLDAALAFAQTNAPSEHEHAFALMRLCKAISTADPAGAARLAHRAHELEPLPFRAKYLAFTQHACGQIRSPAALLAALPRKLALTPAEQDRVTEIQGLARLQVRLPSIPQHAPRAYQPVADSSLYVTASALPFHVSGYTVRSHALIRAIANSGYRVTAALRPGYPTDRGILLRERSHQHETVVYHQSTGPHVRRLAPEQFTKQASQALVELAKRERPQLLHAASNHVNALPALIAARRLGIPFVYEIRGMWELTAATRNLDWEATERFELERSLETLVAREADQVLTLTEGLAADLVARGVPRGRIAIVPNAVDQERFSPRPKDENLMRRFGLGGRGFTLAYAGSLLHYEGLDDVLRALALLVDSGIDAAFVIAGDGEAREPLRALTSELGLESRVHFVGRLEPSDMPRLWSLADAAAFARKPFRVCELVSPLKPLEPMIMGVPVVVSDVAALKEMVRDGETGLVHRAGDAADLAAKLRLLALDPERRQALGRAARTETLLERTWDVTGARVVGLYRGLTGRTHAANGAVPTENSAP